MRGRKYIRKRQIEPDLKYKSTLVSKFINKVMLRGQKMTSVNIVYGAFKIIEEKIKKNPLEVFESAITNASPLLEVKPKRVGGATYQVPMEVGPDRKRTLAIRWILQASRSRQGKGMPEILAEEIINVYNKTGAVMTKRENMHKMAEANKAFAHFARL